MATPAASPASAARSAGGASPARSAAGAGLVSVAAGAGPASARARRWRPLVVAAAAALAFTGAWALLHPPAPPEPTADLYEHLTVARHLLRGDGFLCDVAYPLSFAFPFAARVPQPLVHRPPGPALLLAPVVAATRGDPAAALAGVRVLSLLLLFLLAWAGALAVWRSGYPEAVAPWLLVLLGSPLLAMVALWGQSELPAALLLALLWWRWRPARAPAMAQSPAAAALDGVLAAGVTLLRSELFWVPLLWAVARRRHWTRRAALVAGAAWLLVLAPWAVRNAAVTGSPFFSLQLYGEHLKETPAHPGFDVYRGLAPESLPATLARDPGLVAAKTVAGLRYFAARAHRWLPWPLWLAALAMAATRRRDGRREVDLALILGTVALLTLQYAIWSHTLRHLCVLLPVLLTALWRGLAGRLADALPAWRTWRRALALAAAALACLLLAPARMPGWDAARERAAVEHAAMLRAVATAGPTLPAGPLFTDCGAFLWWTGRAGVWLPQDAAVEARLRLLAPELAAAPVVRVLTSPAPAISAPPPSGAAPARP